MLSNRRTGDEKTNFDGYGDGQSDVFVVTLSDDRGHLTRTTSAVQDIEVADTNGTESSFRLEFGGAISRSLSTSASSAEIQATLMSILGDDRVNVTVSTTMSPSGDVAWRATFLSHLEVRRIPRDTRHIVGDRSEIFDTVLRVRR